jgi:hypothetical protein
MNKKNIILQKEEFTTLEPLQIAASVIRVYMMSNYGNLVYLKSVEWKHPNDHHKTEFIGRLDVAMQQKIQGKFQFIKPFENAGTIVLDAAFQLKSQTPRHIMTKLLIEEYNKRGIKK